MATLCDRKAGVFCLYGFGEPITETDWNNCKSCLAVLSSFRVPLYHTFTVNRVCCFGLHHTTINVYIVCM